MDGWMNRRTNRLQRAMVVSLLVVSIMTWGAKEVHAAVALSGVSTTGEGTNAGTQTVTVQLAGTAAGDILLAILSIDGDVDANMVGVNVPAGFVEILRGDSSGAVSVAAW